MFSHDRFSLSRFSLGAEGNTIQVEGSFSAEMQSVSGVAVPVYASAFMVEVFRGPAKGAIALPFSFRSEAELQADTEMNANILARPFVSETVKGTSVGSRNEIISVSWVDDMSAVSWGSKDSHRLFTLVEQVESSAFASKNILASVFGSEVFTVLSDAGRQSTSRVSVIISIPPGGELRIDSDTFRVLLDGENVLYAQEGDWLNLSRNVLYLDIESATGGELEGSLTYQERFL